MLINHRLATSALDSTSENAVNAAIDDIIHKRNITVVLAAHRLSSIAMAEKVVVLENGVVSEAGRYDVLVSSLGSRKKQAVLIQYIMQSRREGSRFRTLMAAQLLVEKNSGVEDGAPEEEGEGNKRELEEARIIEK